MWKAVNNQIPEFSTSAKYASGWEKTRKVEKLLFDHHNWFTTHHIHFRSRIYVSQHYWHFMFLCLIKWAHPAVFTPPQRGEREIQPCLFRNAVSTGLWLHGGLLAEMPHPWRNRRVLLRRLQRTRGSMFCLLFSFPPFCFLHPCLVVSLCVLRLVVLQRGKQYSLNGTHARLQYAHVGKLHKNCRLCPL